MSFKVGDTVCDCRCKHKRIISIDPDDVDTAVLEDGFRCSISHCLDDEEHSWEHPVDTTSFVKSFNGVIVDKEKR